MVLGYAAQNPFTMIGGPDDVEEDVKTPAEQLAAFEKRRTERQMKLGRTVGDDVDAILQDEEEDMRKGDKARLLKGYDGKEDV